MAVRSAWRLVVVPIAVLMFAEESSAQVPRRVQEQRKREAATPFKPGDEAIVSFRSDWAKDKGGEGMAKATIVDAKSIVLLWHGTPSRDKKSTRNANGFKAAQAEYLAAGKKGDSAAIGKLIDRKMAFRVNQGARVKVVDGSPTKTSASGLPAPKDGCRDVMLLDGPGKGEVVEIPTANLAEAKL